MKRIAFLALLTVFMVGLTYGQSLQMGTFETSPETKGYSLDKGSGDRTMTIEIVFPKPFAKKPDVTVNVNKVDADKDTNLRYRVTAVSVSRDGFSVQVSTWSDSKIFALAGTWIAYAPK